jgi:hypothetical protein
MSEAGSKNEGCIDWTVQLNREATCKRDVSVGLDVTRRSALCIVSSRIPEMLFHDITINFQNGAPDIAVVFTGASCMFVTKTALYHIPVFSGHLPRTCNVHFAPISAQ